MASNSMLLILALLASATTLQTENAFDEVIESGIIDDFPMKNHDGDLIDDIPMKDHDDENDHYNDASEDSFIENDLSTFHPTTEAFEEQSETDSGSIDQEIEDEIFTPSSFEPRVEEVDLPTLSSSSSSNAMHEESVVIDAELENPFVETEDLADSVAADVVSEAEVLGESPYLSSDDQTGDVSSVLTKDAQILELKSQIKSLEEKNEEVEENLEHYVKQESFLYKLIGGQMIEFVCISIGLLLILKISNILLMVTDILENVVIPIVRGGPVYSTTTKQEHSIIF